MLLFVFTWLINFFDFCIYNNNYGYYWFCLVFNIFYIDLIFNKFYYSFLKLSLLVFVDVILSLIYLLLSFANKLN